MKISRTVIISVGCIGIAGISYGQDMNNLKLKDYRPESIYKIPVTDIKKAKYPIIDIHSHNGYVHDEKGIDWWVKNMDDCGIEKVVLLTGETGAKFDTLVKVFSKYPSRFELWCGFDDSGYDSPGYGPNRTTKEKREDNRTVKEWVKSKGLIAGINAGLFQGDDKTNVGYMKNFSFVNNGHVNKNNTIAAFNIKDATVPEFRIIDLASG